jgi:hypothetical protein
MLDKARWEGLPPQDEPGGPLLSVNRVVIPLGQPLQEQRLFQVQGNYTSIAYIP